MSRQAAAAAVEDSSQHSGSEAAATRTDEPRLVATSPDLATKYIARLEGEIVFLREEITTKNAQIKELTERSRETNVSPNTNEFQFTNGPL